MLLPSSWEVVIYIKLIFLFFLFFWKGTFFPYVLLFKAEPYMAFFYNELGGVKYNLAYMYLL